jgi:hypothetical protein
MSQIQCQKEENKNFKLQKCCRYTLKESRELRPSLVVCETIKDSTLCGQKTATLPQKTAAISTMGNLKTPTTSFFFFNQYTAKK